MVVLPGRQDLLKCLLIIKSIRKNMAGEEDVELRDLVTNILEKKGVLGKIRVSLKYVPRLPETDI